MGEIYTNGESFSLPPKTKISDGKENQNNDTNSSTKRNASYKEDVIEKRDPDAIENGERKKYDNRNNNENVENGNKLTKPEIKKETNFLDRFQKQFTRSDSTNDNLIRIDQQNEEWDEQNKWSFSNLVTNIKSIVIKNHIYVAKICGIPNQPNKPGPVIAINIEHTKQNPNTNIIIQTPCVYEKYTIRGKLVQHKSLYPNTITSMVYGNIGGIGKVIILGTQNGYILIYKAERFECILKLNSKKSLKNYFSKNTQRDSMDDWDYQNNIANYCNNHNDKYFPDIYDDSSSEIETDEIKNESNGLIDHNNLSYQISGISVKSTFANFIHWIIAGNMKGHIFIWEVPSGNIVKILMHPMYMFTNMKNVTNPLNSDYYKPYDANINYKKRKKKKKHLNIVKTKTLKNSNFLNIPNSNISMNSSGKTDSSKESSSYSFSESSISDMEEKSQEDENEENFSEFSNDQYMTDSDENNSESYLNDKIKKTNMIGNKKNAYDKCYVSAILAITHKYELWVGFGNGYIAVYDLYDFQLLLYTRISKKPIMDLKYSKILEGVLILIGNDYISIWDTKSLKQIKKIPTSQITKNLLLSSIYILEPPNSWKNKQAILISGCNNGSVCITSIKKKIDGELIFSYIKTYTKNFEPHVPISYIHIDPNINVAFVGDASGVVFTVPQILNTFKHDNDPK
ncbi:conserved Plasmodium protein, unknown function [Plasmodium chabaudi chabaudi]|uniref:Uncharacterized protein n=1 Tax=Plasmodium chabaudi chabaudi TaxID=31271 RepID=A0A1D3LBC0_PLACU|nr:conserved Plasmodium protein, unknown function [Plasmodium chabaudi chabaudi]